MAFLRSLRPFFPLAIPVLALACGSDSGGGDADDGNGGHGGAPGTKTTRTLGQEGGKVTAGGVTLDFPAGAVPKDTEVTVATLSSDQAEALPTTTDGVKLAGFPAKFTPHGLSFEQPVDVTMEYAPPADEATPLVAMKLDNDQDTSWEVVPGAKFESAEASFQITGFSYYGVFEDPNDVAKDLYGPGSQGSGGTGSGGVGSGGVGSGGVGSGSGGDGSGADSGTGATGGVPSGGAPGGGGTGQGGSGGGTAGGGGLSSGGTGGTGAAGGASGGSGGSSATPGYLRTSTIHGYGFMGYFPDPGSSIASDLSLSAGPNCAFGTTNSDSDSYAYLGYKLNQAEFPVKTAPNPPALMAHEGLWIYIAWNSVERPMQVELVDDTIAGAKWCAQVMDSDFLEFIPWANFNSDCVGGEGSSFNPATDKANNVSFKLPSTLADESFDFCIDELSTGHSVYAPPGYLNGTFWFGPGFVVNDPTSSVNQTDLNTALAPNCASGITGDLGGYAGLRYNVNQPQQGTNSPVELTLDGVKVDVNWDGLRAVNVELTSLGQGVTWCAPMPAPGVQFIPYGAFNTSCDGQGSPMPPSALVDSVSVVVPSTDSPGDGFNFCIKELGPSTAPVTGYLSNPAWHGYGFEQVTAGASLNSNLSSSPLPNCATGETSTDPSTSAALLYAVNESPAGGDNSPLVWTENGVWVDFTSSDSRQYAVKLVDSTWPRSWCAILPNNAPSFVPWTSFGDDCLDPGNGSPLNPGTDTYDAVGVVATWTGQQESFDFCIANLEPLPGPPYPNGYLYGPDWFGYGVLDVDALSTQTSDLGSKAAPNCISGQMDVSLSAFSSLRYNVQETVAGGDNTPLFVSGDGVSVGIGNANGQEVRVELYSALESKVYCALFPGVGTFTIPWTSFNDACWTTGGAQFDPLSTEIDQIGFQVVSSGVANDPYNVCLLELQEYTVQP